MLKSTFKVLITAGEPTSIAPEIIAKSLKHYSSNKTFDVNIEVVADSQSQTLIKENAKKINYSNEIIFIEPKTESLKEFKNSALACVHTATVMTLNKQAHAVVTAPVDKQIIAQSYPEFTGHTGFIKKVCGAKDVLMTMHSPEHVIGILSEHIPLKNVATTITKEKIITAVKLLNEYFAVGDEAVAVLGLNPHAGDKGLVGDEEITTIIPAIKELNNMGIKTVGPVPADSAFIRTFTKKTRIALALYHDQGMIPAKINGLNRLVNVSIGLPIIRTCPAHGTAYDLVGVGTASAESLIESIKLAYELHIKRS